MNTSTTTPEFLVGDRVLLHSRPVPEPARITSVHRTATGIEYVISTDGTAERPGRTVNLFTTSGYQLPHPPRPRRRSLR